MYHVGSKADSRRSGHDDHRNCYVCGRAGAATPIKPDDASALLVIDVQNCFLPGGSLAVKDGDQVIPIINRMAKSFANVVMTQDWHTPGHISFALDPCRQKTVRDHRSSLRHSRGTVARSLRPGNRRRLAIEGPFNPPGRLVIRKGFHKDVDSYSAFTEADGKTTTGLAAYLKARKVSRVFVAGLATDFCVAWTALDARKAGFEAYVVEMPAAASTPRARWQKPGPIWPRPASSASSQGISRRLLGHDPIRLPDGSRRAALPRSSP